MTNIGQIMQQAQKVQEKMQEMQKKLGEMDVIGESGAGMVQATINGKGEMQKIKIAPSAVDTDDLTMLEDLIVAAVNDAKRKADQRMQDETQKMMSEMGIPPEMLSGGLPF